MKRQSSFTHRVIAVILVCLLVITGLPITNNIIDVSAGDLTGGDSTTPSTDIDNDWTEYGGWRFTLVHAGYIVDSGNGTMRGNSIAHLQEKYVNYSIVVTNFNDFDGNTDDDDIYTYQDRANIDNIYVQKRVSSVNDIFPDIDSSELDMNFLWWKDKVIHVDVSTSDRFFCEASEDEYGEKGVFDRYVKDDKEKAINQFCDALGIEHLSGENLNSVAIVVEPVTITKKSHRVFSLQQMLVETELTNDDGEVVVDDDGQAIIVRDWSSTFTSNVSVHDVGALNVILYRELALPGKDRVVNVTPADAFAESTSSFTDDDGAFGTAGMHYSSSRNAYTSGFGIYGAGIKATTNNKMGCASATYTLFYNGNASQSSQDFDVYHSTNIIGKDEYSTAHYSIENSEELPSDVGEFKSWSWHDFVGDNNNPTPAGDTVTHRVTGLSSSDWGNYNSYTNLTAGVQKISFADADNRSTSDIVSAVNGTASSIKDIKLSTASTNVTGGNVNVGHYYTLRLGEYSADKIVSNIAKSLANSSTVFKNDSNTTVVNSGAWTGTMMNIATNFAIKASDCSRSLKPVNSDNYSTWDGDQSTMGVSVTVMAKKKDVTSYIAYATLDRETGNLTYNGNDSRTYDVSKFDTFAIPDNMNNLCIYAIVPNDSGYSLENNRDGSSIFSKINAEMINAETLSESELKSAFIRAGLNNVVGSGFITKGQTIKIGCVNDSTAYSILVLQLTGNVTHTSNLELLDYELNYVYPSMLNNGKYGSLLNLKATSWLSTEILERNSDNFVFSDFFENSTDKTVVASSNYAGNIINRNKNLGDNKNILQFDRYTGGYFTTELNARNGYTFRDNLTNVKFSLAVNLVRGDFDNKVTVSSISGQTIDKGYAINNLGLQWGNTAAGSNNATEKRNSNATIGGTLTDNFEWTVKYTLTDSIFANSLIKDVKDTCHLGHKSSDKILFCTPIDFYKVLATETPGSLDGTRVKYVVSERAYKYQTDTIGTATNSTKTIDTSLQVTTNGINNSSSVITNPYKITVVSSSNKTLGFYPEVRMRAYSTTGDKITASLSASSDVSSAVSGAVTSHTVKVLGEIRRTLKPSSMYTIKVTAPNNDVVTGTTASDSIAVGSNASNISGGLPVIYAGGNISLNVTPNFKLNMYGYSLDLIETTDNNLTGTGNYSTVVADNSPIKSDWGNDSSYKPLDDFNSWIDDTLGKIAVDTTLTVNGSGVNKTYNNFASSLGSLGTNEATASGVYSIKIERGTIVDDGGYQALIAQIKSDYGCTEAQAKEIFEKSDIYQSIARAVESCNDNFNTSRRTSAIDGSRDHWYDEEVKTFVIRRFVKEDISIKNILINDKIDYGAAPTANTDVSSTSSMKKATAKWYLTLYFKELPTGFTDGTTLYNPVNYSGLANANANGTVLVNECYINGADFVIPSSSTNSMTN